MSTSEQKIFFVSLTIRLGEYEKTVESFREATSKADAEFEALCGETHNEPLSRAEFDEGETWWDDYMIYEASAAEIPNELACTLKEYNEYPLSLIK